MAGPLLPPCCCAPRGVPPFFWWGACLGRGLAVGVAPRCRGGGVLVGVHHLLRTGGCCGSSRCWSGLSQRQGSVRMGRHCSGCCGGHWTTNRCVVADSDRRRRGATPVAGASPDESPQHPERAPVVSPPDVRPGCRHDGTPVTLHRVEGAGVQYAYRRKPTLRGAKCLGCSIMQSS